MLGNFSFGDYFKEDAIRFGWEFMTVEMRLNPEELFVSIYSNDDEAFNIWNNKIGVPESRILRFGDIEKGDEENFWSMGSTGPCGPCSEIYIDRGSSYGPDDPYKALAENTPRFLELWNLVFMQFNRNEKGELDPLPKPSIDTGLGLERMAMVKQRKENIFETDILGNFVKRIEELTDKKYDDKTGMAFRVAADHVRTLTFAIADGALPSNEGRGYVIRRILRRASRYLRELGKHEPLLYLLVGDVVTMMKNAYPEIGERADYISMVIKGEEERFLRTLDQGVDLFDRLVTDVRSKGGHIIKGEDAFKLYDTYGFPIDLTKIMAEEKGIVLDMEGFETAMELQRVRAREASSFAVTEDKGGLWVNFGDKHEKGSIFVGYDNDTVSANLLRYRHIEKESVELVFDKTPFYALSGGQVSDTGTISSSKSAFELSVIDVYDLPDAGRVHVCTPLKGEFSPELIKSGAVLTIDTEKRRSTERNHSATHLLQAGLQKILGGHVRQSGSFVDSERLRFDFNHFSGLKKEELDDVEEFVFRKIMENHAVEITSKTLEEARAEGAMSLFDEKYGDIVRLVRMGDVSKELCGGTHVKHTGDIGLFRIVSESSVAAGIRRIEAVTGIRAFEMSRHERNLVHNISANLNIPPDGIIERLESTTKKIRDLEKEIKKIKTSGHHGMDSGIVTDAITVKGVKIAFGKVEVSNAEELKAMADNIRSKLGSGIGILGAETDGKVSLVVTVTDDLISIKNLKAGDIIKKLAEKVGGSGGGRPHLAMAGGKDISKLGDALKSVPEIVAEFIK